MGKKGKTMKTWKRKCWVIEQKAPSCIDNGFHFVHALHRPSKTANLPFHSRLVSEWCPNVAESYRF